MNASTKILSQVEDEVAEIINLEGIKDMNKLNFGISISAIALAIISFAFSAGFTYKSVNSKLIAHDGILEKLTDDVTSLQFDVKNIKTDLTNIKGSYLRKDEVKLPVDEREFLFQSGSHTTPGKIGSKFYRCFFKLELSECDIDNDQSVYRKTINFDEKFSKIPKVHVAFRYISAKPNELVHIYSKVENVSESGFTLKFKSPQTSKVREVGFIWFAYTSPRTSH